MTMSDFPGGLGAPGPPVRVRSFSPDEQTGYNLNYSGKKNIKYS